MTFNDNAKIDSSKVRRRGRTTGIAAGGGGLAVVAIFLVAQLFGVDLSGLVDTGGSGTSSEEALANCDTGAEANASVDCLIAGANDSLDHYWAAELPSTGVAYHRPGVELFDGQTNTGCGTASSATGPFYCPPDESIFIDPAFYDDLRSKYGSSGGPLAEMYVLAHEFGHHIQNLSGTMTGLDLAATGPASDSVRLEVQADCFAGAWVGQASTVPSDNGTTFLSAVTDAQIADALTAASAVGDDRIQKAATGTVNKESWTHGSSAQRQKWFTAGYSGGPSACDTFAVPAAAL